MSRLPLLVLLALSLLPPASAPAAPAAPAPRWVRTELYVGTSEGGRPDVSPEAWATFVTTEVAARFPDGLFVLDAYGQWKGTETGLIEHSESKVIILVYEDTPPHRAAVEAIRVAWKKTTGYVSVLKSTQPVEVSF